jgi:dimethylargininase
MRLALTRSVPSSLSRCELTHLARLPINVARAKDQHAAYEAALEAAGCTLVRLPALDESPDSVFVEDAALVFDDIAVVTRPGAESRRGETASVAAALAAHRPLAAIESPATIDGGDVLRIGRAVFVGVSTRTSMEAVEQLRGLLEPIEYIVQSIEVRGCLHLKSAVTAVDDDLILVNPDWVDVRQFPGLRALEVHPDEPHAANVLRVGDAVICAAAFPLTRHTLEANGYATIAVDVSELAKAEGGVTCCAIVLESRIANR